MQQGRVRIAVGALKPRELSLNPGFVLRLCNLGKFFCLSFGDTVHYPSRLVCRLNIMQVRWAA